MQGLEHINDSAYLVNLSHKLERVARSDSMFTDLLLDRTSNAVAVSRALIRRTDDFLSGTRQPPWPPRPVQNACDPPEYNCSVYE
jgi:hypothetical protein